MKTRYVHWCRTQKRVFSHFLPFDSVEKAEQAIKDHLPYNTKNFEIIEMVKIALNIHVHRYCTITKVIFYSDNGKTYREHSILGVDVPKDVLACKTQEELEQLIENYETRDTVFDQKSDYITDLDMRFNVSIIFLDPNDLSQLEVKEASALTSHVGNKDVLGAFRDEKFKLSILNNLANVLALKDNDKIRSVLEALVKIGK